MALPTRPVSGAPIESAWGQVIHDRVLAAAGCDLYDTTPHNVNSTSSQLYLGLAHDDPGGYLDAANNRAEVPTDGEGLYLIIATVNGVNGTAGEQFRVFILLNGTNVASGVATSAGGTNIRLSVPTMQALTATDQLEVWGQRVGSGTTPTLTVPQFTMLRLTDSYGAP